jgi:hypothetical protein
MPDSPSVNLLNHAEESLNPISADEPDSSPLGIPGPRSPDCPDQDRRRGRRWGGVPERLPAGPYGWRADGLAGQWTACPAGVGELGRMV